LVKIPEKELYPAVLEWLEGNKYEGIVTGGRRVLSIPMVSYLPGKIFLEPDIVGLRELNELVAVEVKADPKAMLEGLGKCLVYSTAADKVYLALTDSLCQEIRSVKLFQSLRIGLLSLTRKRPSHVLPPDASDTMKSIAVLKDVADRSRQMEAGGWFAEEIVPPGINYNVDFGGLRQELLRQTRAALGKDHA
jgi:hypothetical protein